MAKLGGRMTATSVRGWKISRKPLFMTDVATASGKSIRRMSWVVPLDGPGCPLEPRA